MEHPFPGFIITIVAVAVVSEGLLGFNHEANRSKELIKTLRNYHVHTSAICVLLASCYEEARMKAMQHLLAGSPLHHGQTSACTVRTRVSCAKIKYYFLIT